MRSKGCVCYIVRNDLLMNMKRLLVACFGLSAIMLVASLVFCAQTTFAIAKESSITVTISEEDLEFTLLPGNFGKSIDNEISVTTDNYTGYSLSIASESSTSLVSTQGNQITSIGSSIDETTFSTNNNYYNKWGYKPNQYVTVNNNLETTVQNTDYLPVPSTSGELLAVTSAANASGMEDDYTVSFAAKIDSTFPSGEYVGTYVLTVVANMITYNVTYDANTAETVTGMPSPNPQALEIAGGTPTADSHAALSSATPVMTTGTIMTFGGWCDVATTVDSTTGNYLCSGTTYQAGDDYPIDQTVDGSNITLYAIWLKDTFPVVWSQMGKCEFHGNAPSNITGSECSAYWNDKYIDTGIALNSQANASKDYEIHFTIDHYLPSENPTSKNDGQQTFVSSKVPSSTTIGGGSAPGVIVRRANNNISFESKINTSTADNPKLAYAASEVQEASMYRIDGILYVSINGGPLVLLQDLTNYNQYFDLTTWFGAYPATSGCDGSMAHPCDTSKRYIEAELSDMYIRLGDYDSANLHSITFDANGGTPATTNYLVFDGNALGTLPEVTQTDWMFDAWYTASSGGQAISAATVPTATTTYYAHWYKSVTDAQIDRTDFHLSVNDTGVIDVLNASDIEPYTLVSNDTSVVTVNQSTGVITAVGNGVTTITMTGAKTGDTRTINVAVGNTITVNFDSDGGTPATYEWSIIEGDTFSDLPAPIRTGYTLEGWYTGTDGTGTQLTTSTVIDSNAPTQYYANWDEAIYVCKIAEPNTLHVEQCNQSGSNGCRGAGIASGADIQYGQIVSSTTMTTGDAYNCNVNNDTDWNDTTERFYYFGTENGNAKFVYSQSLENSDQSFDDAIGYLPTSATWTNPGLVAYTSGDFEGKVARFMTYAEALALCGSSNLGVNGNCTYLLEKSAFANQNSAGYRDGIWLGKNGTNACRIQTRTRALTNGGTQANTPRPTIEVPLSQVEPYVQTTYEITFEPHNGTNSWTETINAGDQLGAAYPANDPTYTDYVFQGWFTAASGGTLVTSSLQPTGDAHYHAQWKGTVALANITNTNINIQAGFTETIAVTNAADIESYSFTSNDTSVATVDSSTGVVTGVSAGSTTVTMTGQSGATRTINVTVTTAPAATVTIHFNPHGGAAVADRTINLGDSVGIPLPSAPTYDNNHLFQGWFTADTGGTQIDGSETPNTETTYHAQWKKTVSLADLDSDDITVVEGETETIVVNNASELEGYSFTSANSSVASVDASTGVITGHVESVTTITMTGTTSGQTKTINVRVVTEQNPYVCTLAAAGTLHSANNITYGQIATNTTPQAGDAYDCDVDYDGTFDPDTERFYYLGTDSNTNAVLVAYNSYYNNAWAPGVSGSSGDTIFTYANALDQLPSNASGYWDNPNLIEQSTGKAARFMEKTEVTNVCSSLTDCPYLMEHSAFDNGGRTALWLKYDGSKYWRIHTTNKNIAEVSNPNGSNNMVRPAIVVPYSKIEKYTPTMHTVTFNSMGGSTVGDAQVEDGTALGQNYPATDPTKVDNMFFGWYDTASYDHEVTPDTVVNSNVTYYAKWVGNTTNFPIVWSEKNACIFGGSGVNVSGDYCTQLKTRDYVDTGIALYDNTNYGQDYEIGFKVVSWAPTASQETIFNEKYENSGASYPGIMLRSNGADTDMAHKISGTAATANTVTISTLTDVKIVRQGGVVKYAFNGGTLTDLQDLNQLTRQEFNTTVWFGASATDSNTSQRQSHSTLTDMYIRLGTYEAGATYNITFDGNGGTPSESTRSVNAGQQIGALPTVTRAGNYTFLGWLDENDNPVTATTVPIKNETYHADWSYTPSDTPVSFDTSNDAMTGYYNIIEGWTTGAANITRFNKDTTTINNSTWGDTSVLSEANFQAGLRANFENYSCDMQRDYNGSSESKWNWNSGNVNCSKPKVYDTGVNDELTVYLYDTSNSTVGNKVYYTKSDNGTITNLVPGKTYKWEQTSDHSVYGYVTATADHGTRFIDAGGTNNVRDLGGLEVDTNDDGVIDGTLKYERLYRGGKVVGGSAGVEAITNLAKTSDNVPGEIIEYDVAGDQPAYFPLSESYPVIHYNFDYNTNDLTNYNAARAAINAIMDDVIDGGSIYFHCRVGADRTGTTAYLLEGLLGVSDEDRYREYELTHLGGLSDRTRYYKQKDSGNNKKFVFMMDYVLTKGNIMTWYMKGSSDTPTLHPDQDRIDAFRQAMIQSNQ